MCIHVSTTCMYICVCYFCCSQQSSITHAASLVSRQITCTCTYTSEMHSNVGASVSKSLGMFMVYVCKARLLEELEINVAYNATL